VDARATSEVNIVTLTASNAEHEMKWERMAARFMTVRRLHVVCHACSPRFSRFGCASVCQRQQRAQDEIRQRIREFELRSAMLGSASR
jgi:hypothetical protein